MVKMTLLLVMLSAATGCVLINPTDPYAGMGAYGGQQDAWAGIRTAAVQSVEGPVSLEDAIRVALANNPELAATAHDVDAAAAQRDVAASQRFPSVHAIGGYSHYLDSQRLVAASENGEPGVFSRDVLAADLVVSMPLFTGGRITSEIKAAELLQKAAQHQLARTQEELVFNVSSVFYGILARRKVIESLEFSKTTLQEHLKRIQELIAAQKAAKVDRLRTEVRIADLEQALVRERNVVAIQERVLTNFMGLDRPEKPVEAAGDLALVPASIPEKEQAFQKAFRDRPDYLSARAALEAQARAVDAARAAHWPVVTLQGAYGGRWAADTTDKPSGLNSSDDVGRVGLGFDIPIFEGGRILARVRQERARLSAAQERLRSLELQIQLDIETALLNIASTSQQVQTTEKAIEQANESLRIEREKYDLGKGAIVDVLDAQSALLDSQTNYYRALAEYNIALAQLKLATGEK
jgi:outer membrane protein TolC